MNNLMLNQIRVSVIEVLNPGGVDKKSTPLFFLKI